MKDICCCISLGFQDKTNSYSWLFFVSANCHEFLLFSCLSVSALEETEQPCGQWFQMPGCIPYVLFFRDGCTPGSAVGERCSDVSGLIGMSWWFWPEPSPGGILWWNFGHDQVNQRRSSSVYHRVHHPSELSIAIAGGLRTDTQLSTPYIVRTFFGAVLAYTNSIQSLVTTWYMDGLIQARNCFQNPHTYVS